MSERARYSPLGKLLTNAALKRGVVGAEAISDHLWTEARYDVSAMSVEEYLYGHDKPPREFIPAFVEAFALSEQEAKEIAFTAFFGKLPPFS